MYERFTTRAREVTQLANQEAMRLNCKYIGAEHILLALAKTESCTATIILKHADVRLERTHWPKHCRNDRPHT